MPDESIEKRLSDVEAVITDLPALLNLRFERVDAGAAEVAARLNLIDKQISILTRDVRDLRGGVTRQLVAQDEQLAVLAAKLDEVLGRLPPRP